MKFNKIKIYFFSKHLKPLSIAIFLISLISFRPSISNAEYLSEELQIDRSTKTDSDSPGIPTNPFEIVEIIRRYNSMNDATNPSDAIDDALESFNSLEGE